jgi:hypothetical protein
MGSSIELAFIICVLMDAIQKTYRPSASQSVLLQFEDRQGTLDVVSELHPAELAYLKHHVIIVVLKSQTLRYSRSNLLLVRRDLLNTEQGVDKMRAGMFVQVEAGCMKALVPAGGHGNR